MKGTTAIVSPAFDAFYYSFYIKGLQDLFGKENIVYSGNRFPLLSGKCLAIILRRDGEEICRIAIDCRDGAEIRERDFDWCDRYGKVNYSRERVQEAHRAKVFPIGPSFGIRVWNPVESWRTGLANLILLRRGAFAAKEYLLNYRRQYRYRLGESSYCPGESDGRYVFFLSSLWKEEQGKSANTYRKIFIRACRENPIVRFEGGFAPLLPGHHVQGYEDDIVARRYPLSEYLDKLKRSALVFNTPAVYSCHGWKLGEYLALGKAIVSTPLTREMPAPFLHGEHAHFVDGSADSIHSAVDRIIGDPAYRRRLECGARAYYEAHLSPRRVMEKMTSPGNVQQH